MTERNVFAQRCRDHMTTRKTKVETEGRGARKCVERVDVDVDGAGLLCVWVWERRARVGSEGHGVCCPETSERRARGTDPWTHGFRGPPRASEGGRQTNSSGSLLCVPSFPKK